MLFNEPKLLKCRAERRRARNRVSFSALQRAEIAEMPDLRGERCDGIGFSALQRAEIAEMRVGSRFPRFAREFQCSSTSRNC